MQGTLRVVDLKTNPKFAALSYVWGPNSNPQDVIICNQCRIPLTASCNDALRSLRKLYGGIAIWVDSVCINQNDNDEKARQIPLMEDIYTWAVEVYIWLGQELKPLTKPYQISFMRHFFGYHWLACRGIMPISFSHQRCQRECSSGR